MQTTPKLLSTLVLTAAIVFGQTPKSLSTRDPAPAIRVEELLQAPPDSRATLDALKGRVIVLEFWATWCGPCVAAIPHLNALLSNFRKKPIQFLFITDEERWRVEKFLKLRPIDGWIALNPSRSTFDRYGVEALPRTVIIDSEGLIAAVTAPEEVTESLLDNVLARKPIATPRVSAAKSKTDVRPLMEMLVRSAQPGHSMRSNATEITAQGARLRDIVGSVYQFSAARIEMEPALAETTYDVSFIVPPNRKDSLAPLAKDALSTALSLAVTKETQLRDVLVLTAPSGTGGLRRSPQQRMMPILSDDGQVVSKGTSLASFAAVLESALKEPVLDETGSQGFFDLALYWKAEDQGSVMKAVREQLNLELKSARRPIEILVVKVSGF